jgi:capsular exopolysaccharide synthesis family protein
MPNLMGLLLALQRRWFLASFLGLLGGGLAAASVWFAQKESHTARSLVQVASVRPHIIAETERVNFTNYQQTQIALLRSRLVLNAALREPKVAELAVVTSQTDPVLWLEKAIKADFSVAPEILKISMTGEDPDELTKLVNAIRDAYMREILGKEGTDRRKRLDKLKEIFGEADRTLQSKRDLLRKMAEELGSSKDSKVMEKTQELALKTMDNLLKELLVTQSKLRRARMDLDIQRARKDKGIEGPVPAFLIDDYIKKDPAVQRYVKQLAKIDDDLKVAKERLRAPESDASYKRLLTSRDAVQKELDEWRKQARPSVEKYLREYAKSEVVVAQTTLEEEVILLEKQDAWLTEETSKREQTIQHLSKRRVDVEWLRDEIALADDLARKMASQIQILTVEQLAPERIQVLEAAYSTPDTDARIKKAGMAGGGVLAFFVLGVALLEFRTRRVSNIDQVVRGLKLGLMGALPTVPRGAKRSPTGSGKAKDAKWQSHLAESVDATRTMLLRTAQNESLRLLMITSAVSGEGKTMTSCHLAISLARSGRKTLLIDADLRRPSVHKLFNLAQQPGLSEVLRGEIDLAAAVQTGVVNGLSILCAGTSDDQTLQALAQPALEEVFRQAREQYDFILVDSAPVLPVADSQLIAQQADGVIFAVLRDVSRLPQIYAASERLNQLRVRILGAIINGTEGAVSKANYQYYRSYGK